MLLFVNCYVVFPFLFFSLNNYVRVRYIQLSFGNKVATFLGKNCNSACLLFILWLLNCISLSFLLVLGA